MTRLLLVHDSHTRATFALTQAVRAGARDPEMRMDGVEVVVCPALDADAEDFLGADGYILGITVAFWHREGAVAHLLGALARIDGTPGHHDGANSSRGPTAGRPFGLYVHGEHGADAVASALGFTRALGWTQAAGVRATVGDLDDTALASAYALGATLAARVARLRG